MSRVLAATVSAVLALTGCSLSTDDDASESTGAPASSDTPAGPSPSESEAAAPESLAPPVEASCTSEEIDAIDATISGQLDAFADGDYDRALTYASEGFQAGLDAEAFEQVIRQGFPVVARDAVHRTRRCVTLSGEGGVAGQALVAVTAVDGESVDLVYLLLVEDDRWVISGATPVVPAGDESESVVA